jgi:hypothetical protein
MEGGLSKVEALIAPLLRTILQRRELPTSTTDFDTLLNFVAMQYARVPATRKMLAAPLAVQRKVGSSRG